MHARPKIAPRRSENALPDAAVRRFFAFPNILDRQHQVVRKPLVYGLLARAFAVISGAPGYPICIG